MRRMAAWALLPGALALPFVLQATGMDYYQQMASRIVILAIAATSLNLILGYGGLVSFGHAAFVGLGSYATAILVTEGVSSGWIHLAATIGVCGLAGVVIGVVALRTRGVHFIMITLAFAQMLHYLANSIKGYGGDEGLTIRARSQFDIGIAVLDLKQPWVLYGVAVALLAVLIAALDRFLGSPAGLALKALRDDELRAESLGFPTFRLRLAAFVGAAIIGGVAGLLLVDLQGYVSPDSLHWTQSGMLMVMVVVGGVGSRLGGLLGAAALLLIEEWLGDLTAHGPFWTGWVLLAIVLFARQGLAGWLAPAGHDRVEPR